ncbi:MAG: helix-turn-helix domain-containing protein, partial [Desulfovibrionaceae bacterium]
ALTEYDWPGNVREMENLVERLVIMVDSDQVGVEALAGRLEASPAHSPRPTQPPVPGPDEPSFGPPSTLADMEKKEVVRALERTGYVQHKAGRELGLTARQLGYRVRKYGLEAVIAEGKARLRRSRAGR